MNNSPVSDFMETHFRHFNARETIEAAKHYRRHVDQGGKMMVSLAGAMSTAELGISLAKMIREDKVHAISCTGANLEEDVFNLIGKKEYRPVPNYADLSPEDELELFNNGYNRVTDTCIPEKIFRKLENHFLDLCIEKEGSNQAMFPAEIFFELFKRGTLEPYYQIPTKNSWLMAAWERNIPVFSPGFEDCTLGNVFTARVMQRKIMKHSVIKPGTAQMERLVKWYRETDQSISRGIGFFQIGGGIAGDFAICVVPLIIQDLNEKVRLWQYFSQISDAVTSYGGYSGAVPNEKITWCKLDVESPKFMIHSDASIVAPLIFAYVLGQ